MAAWCRIPLAQVWELRELDWLALRRDAFVHEMRQTKGGREWLANAWRLGQSQADSEGLREAFG